MTTFGLEEWIVAAVAFAVCWLVFRVIDRRADARLEQERKEIWLRPHARSHRGGTPGCVFCNREAS